MKGIKRSVRRSQTVVPFGPGAIYDFGNESLVALDTSRWPVESCGTIRLPRLEEQLGVDGFKEAPVTEGSGDAVRKYSVPFMRFPQWLFCPECDRMTRWSEQLERPGEAPACRNCGAGAKLAPMRFVSVCSDGHLMDVPWSKLAHSQERGRPRCEYGDSQLKFFNNPSKGGGLQSLSVRCKCGAERSFEHLCNPEFLKTIGAGKCSGRHPWQKVEYAEPCERVPSVVQRGESNAYFAETLSALDITDSGDSTLDEINGRVTAHTRFPTIRDLYSEGTSRSSTVMKKFVKEVATAVQCTEDEVWNCVAGEKSAHRGQMAESTKSAIEKLKAEEWEAFQKAVHIPAGRNFVTQRIDFDHVESELPAEEQATWAQFRNLVKSVVLARRIRIVKALTGFRRLDNAGRKLPPHLKGSLGWLPATEIFGEGILLEFDLGALDAWATQIPCPNIDSMVAKQKRSGLGASFDVATPKSVVLHTFAHLLMRQLTFECGYSSSSLAERIYCGENMAGIFIYTGSADSEGSLGGLVREGEADRIYSIVKTALFRGQWCSNDPICSEMPYQGLGGMNRAACHACALVAETSCELANTLLDRGLLFGGSKVKGLFQRLLDQLQDAA